VTGAPRGFSKQDQHHVTKKQPDTVSQCGQRAGGSLFYPVSFVSHADKDTETTDGEQRITVEDSTTCERDVSAWSRAASPN
jgi:cephalosporin hydroxylase